MEIPSKIKTAVTLHKIYGWIYIVIAVLMFLLFLVITLLLAFGAGVSEDAATGLGVLITSVSLGGIMMFVAAIIGGIGGLHLLCAKGIEDRKEWAKIMGIILSVLMLGSFPLGTIFAIFILIGLFDASANEWFVTSSPSQPETTTTSTPEKK